MQHPRSGPMRPGAILPILVPASVLLTLGLVAGCTKQSSEATAARRDIIAYLPVQGTIVAQPSARADIFAPYQAPVQKIYATVGANVRRGETLVDFSAPPTQAYYEQTRLSLIQAQKSLDQARTQYDQALRAAQKQLATSRSTERKARAGASTSGSGDSTSGSADIGSTTSNRQADEQAVIDAQARMAEGMVPFQQAVLTAQQQFEAAKAGSKSAQLKSPISGTVLAMNVSVGVTPDPKDKKPLVTVVDLGALKVAAGVPEERLNLLRPKDPAAITVKEVPNVGFKGVLDEIYSEKAGFLQGQKYIALLDFDNTRGQAKPGMEARASIKLGEVHKVLAVPANAPYKVGDQFAVKLREGSDWHQRIVEVGLSDGNYTEIKSGLKEGDVVMTNP